MAWSNLPFLISEFLISQIFRLCNFYFFIVFSMDLNQVLSKKQTIYAGFDPTAPSLHVGNLLVLVTLLKLHHQGHRIIVLIGDATAQIGDPSGKTTERPLIEKKVIEANSQGLFEDISNIREKALGKKHHQNSFM